MAEMEFLQEMSISKMAEVYNRYAKDLGKPMIKKFETRQSGEKRLSEIMAVHLVWKEEQRLMKEAEKMEQKVKEGKNTQRGRVSTFKGKKITSLVQENPRVAGSHGWQSMKIILDNPGITYEEFIQKGGRRVDLAWDLKYQRLELA
jgi:predicted GIY-YIG superfamily endonuclease